TRCVPAGPVAHDIPHDAEHPLTLLKLAPSVHTSRTEKPNDSFASFRLPADELSSTVTLSPPLFAVTVEMLGTTIVPVVVPGVTGTTGCRPAPKVPAGYTILYVPADGW